MKALLKYKSESKILAAVYETVSGLYKCGGVDEAKMREFDELCLSRRQLLRIQERRKRRNSLDCNQGGSI
jgi:DNA-binding transcriptional regulator YiaG